MLKNQNIRHYSPLLLEHPDLAASIAGLPAVNLQEKLRGESAYYGAADMIARETGLAARAGTKKICWEHGWKYNPISTPEQMSGYSDPKKTYLVANDHHKNILVEAGYSFVHVVGMPYVYAPSCNGERIPNSLLVCPGHATNFSDHDWTEFANAYAEAILSVKDMFSTVVVCLTANCIERDQWIEAFEERGIPWVMGASIFDRNALIRMRSLFGRFEYVTSNMLGSHLLYAAYESCKVSIWKWQSLYSADGFKNEPLFLKNPELLKQSVWYTHEWQVEHYGFLFKEHPGDGSQLRDWAAKELGEAHKRTVEEVAGLFGWQRELDQINRTGRPQCEHALTPVQSEQSGVSKFFAQRRWQRSVRSLLKSNRNEARTISFLGGAFHYTDASCFVQQVDQVFNHCGYIIEAQGDAPLMIDIGADVGVGLLGLKQRFPNARIIGLEPDPARFECLEANAKSYQLSHCELHRATVGIEAEVREYPAGDLVSGSEYESSTKILVPVRRLRDLLSGTLVDFFRLNSVDRVFDLLQHSEDQLRGVACICILFQSRNGSARDLEQTLALLERVKFEIRIEFAGSEISKPLEELYRMLDSTDEALRIYGCR